MEMLVYVLAFLVILIVWGVAKYLKWKREIYDHLEKIGGPKAYPIIGNLYLFFGAKRSDIFKIFLKMVKENGNFFRIYSFFKGAIDIQKPEHLEVILSSSVHVKKGSLYQMLKEWLGDGLLISEGAKWHQRRKMITPAFHFKMLEHCMPVFAEKANLLVDHLEEKSDGNGFDIYPYITHCALDIICETAMGVTVNAMSDKNNSYVRAIYSIGELIMHKQVNILHQTPLYPYLKDGKAFYENLKTLHGFTDKVISDRKKLLEKKENPSNVIPEDDLSMTKKKRLSFLDLLLESAETISDEDIRGEVNTFMFAGHDTTTSAMCWNLYLFAQNQDAQEQAYQEIKSVFQDKKAPNSISDLNELRYLECCIKESMRLLPSVPIIIRELTEDIYLDGFKVPKGTDCNIDIYHAHRNPEIYPDPEKYDPDRFLPENSRNRHPYAYVPFSAGPRNCIGQKFAMYEEKTILSTLLRSYKVLPVDTPETITLISELVLRPENGLQIALVKRTD